MFEQCVSFSLLLLKLGTMHNARLPHFARNIYNIDVLCYLNLKQLLMYLWQYIAISVRELLIINIPNNRSLRGRYTEICHLRLTSEGQKNFRLSRSRLTSLVSKSD